MVARLHGARAVNAVANDSKRVGASLGQDRTRQQSFRFTAPVGGIADLPYSRQERTPYARVLRNFWPTVNGLEPRGGMKILEAVDRAEWDQVIDYMVDVAGTAMFHYSNRAGTQGAWALVGEGAGNWDFNSTSVKKSLKLTGSSQRDRSPVATVHQGGGRSYAIVVGENVGMGAYAYERNDAWSFVKFGTSNGHFSESPNLSLRGGGDLPASFNYVFKYSNRVVFLSGSTAFYTNAGAAWGELSKIDLDVALTLGGDVVFGTTWTYDAGDGLNDRCLFFTDQGEMVSYVGDPGSSEFTLEGGVLHRSPSQQALPLLRRQRRIRHDPGGGGVGEGRGWWRSPGSSHYNRTHG